MIQMDAPLAAIFVTILLALLGFAAAWGVLTEKVRNNRKDIESNRRENRQDHQQIFAKLDDIKKEIANNGRLKPGG